MSNPLRDFGQFLLREKKWWLVPMIVVVAIVVVLVVYALMYPNSAPFVYGGI